MEDCSRFSAILRGKGFYLRQNMPKALVALRNTSESNKRKKGGKSARKEKLLN
jgi:hypothetical protein